MERKIKEELVNLTSNILVNLENQLPPAPDDHISYKLYVFSTHMYHGNLVAPI